MTSEDSARVLAPPPLIYGAFFALGYLTRGLLSRELVAPPYNWTFGFVLVLIGMVLVLLPASTLLRAKTALSPYHATSRIVTTGLFSVSRNPIYLGLTAGYLGVAIAFNLTVAVLLTPLVLLAMYYGVIRREEAYLERKFGDEYRQYKARVRRWL
ncbi:MAG TPA: isoprenylcysteine carboxylmethyltransferase family protein [Thermoanaerobaculia bacterium]|nr:isoprenylcysteine carboxylmethyltransferase family protein [Thermoanaerobaculia bacterium]